MRAHRYRVPLAILVTALAATGATLLLRPRGGTVEPAAASASDYFTPAHLQKAHDFRGPQRATALASLGLRGAVLVLRVVRPPRAARRRLERAGARPLLGAAGAGAVYAI